MGGLTIRLALPLHPVPNLSLLLPLPCCESVCCVQAKFVSASLRPPCPLSTARPNYRRHFFSAQHQAAKSVFPGIHSPRYLTSNSPQLLFLIPISVLLALSRKPGLRPSATAATASPPRPSSFLVCPSQDPSLPYRTQSPSTVVVPFLLDASLELRETGLTIC